MIKELNTNNITSKELQDLLYSTISYFKFYGNEMIFKIKGANVKQKTLDIFAYSKIDKVLFNENFESIYIYFNNDNSMILNTKSYDILQFECYDLDNEDFETTINLEIIR